jgi:hypothetical protein
MNDIAATNDEYADNLDTRALLTAHWKALEAGRLDAEHGFYHQDAVLEYPQSGERIAGSDNIKASRDAGPRRDGFRIRSILGQQDLWVTEYSVQHDGHPGFIVSIMELRDRKVIRETQYIAEPFAAPAWRANWLAPKP